MSLESNTIYRKYKNRALTAILPGHVRADLATQTGVDLADSDVVEYLTTLLRVVKEFWKGRLTSLAHLCNTFGTDFPCTAPNGAGAITYSNDEIIYTEGGTPSGAFEVNIIPGEYHGFLIRDGAFFLANQDAAVSLTLDIYGTAGILKTRPVFAESLDNLQKSIRGEGTDYRDIWTGEQTKIIFASAAEIDASTAAKMVLRGEVL